MTDERDDYLWDKSGERDAQVERLERVLARYRYDRARDGSEWVTRKRAPRWVHGLLLAAGLLIGLSVWRAFLSSSGLGGYEVSGIANRERVDVGEQFETRDDSAVLRVAELGNVRVEPGSRLRVDDDGREAHRLFLERGAVHATIFARPREFQIGTPAGLSVDLGCEYDLAVDDAGRTSMTVTTGRVAFEAHGRSVIVPAGATCQATESEGPNVPVRVEAERSFVAAVRALESAAEPDARDVETVLRASVRDESVTLWHLFLVTSSPELRAKLFARLEAVHPLPDRVGAELLLARESTALAAWRAIVEREWGWR